MQSSNSIYILRKHIWMIFIFIWYSKNVAVPLEVSGQPTHTQSGYDKIYSKLIWENMERKGIHTLRSLGDIACVWIEYYNMFSSVFVIIKYIFIESVSIMHMCVCVNCVHSSLDGVDGRWTCTVYETNTKRVCEIWYCSNISPSTGSPSPNLTIIHAFGVAFEYSYFRYSLMQNHVPNITYTLYSTGGIRCLDWSALLRLNQLLLFAMNIEGINVLKIYCVNIQHCRSGLIINRNEICFGSFGMASQ